MSLTGILYPKMIVNITTTLDEVLLQHAVVLKDQPEQDTHFVRAVRTGKRVFTNAGKHWLFQIKIYLYKYANAETKYLELKGYEGTKVYLHRHADGEMIYDTYNNAGAFILSSVAEEYTDEKNKYDVVILTFKSLNYIQAVIVPVPEGSFYYMNDTNDTPQGSIGAGITGSGFGNIYEMSNIGTDVKSFDGDLGLQVVLTVNGFKAQLCNAGGPYYGTLKFDAHDVNIFSGFVDTTAIVAFKRTTADENLHFIFNHYSTNYAQWILLFFLNGANLGKLDARMSSGGTYGGTNEMNCITANRYDDNEWHIAAVVFKQTEKKVFLYTETGEAIEATNSNYASGNLATNIADNPQLGYWKNPGYVSQSYFGNTETYPAIGDVLFFNGALTKGQINNQAHWVANRLGITWNNIL